VTTDNTPDPMEATALPPTASDTPAVETDLTLPVEEPSTTEPVDETDLTLPVEEPFTTELVDKTDLKLTVEEPFTTEPVDETDLTLPVEEPPATETADSEDGEDEEPDELAGIVEALIFASDEPLTFKVIKDVLVPADQRRDAGSADAGSASTDVAEARADDAGSADQGSTPASRRRSRRRLTITQVTTAIASLNDAYERTGRVFRIIEVSGGFAFQTIGAYGGYVGRLFADRSRRRLTQSALETLAIIAFKQPISKPVIEAIRGVSAEYVVKSLLEKGLISIVGRDEGVGRPLLYGTTKTFLKHFGLRSINDLPKPREIEDLLSEENSFGESSIEEIDDDTGEDSPSAIRMELQQLLEAASRPARAAMGAENEGTQPQGLRIQFDGPQADTGEGPLENTDSDVLDTPMAGDPPGEDIFDDVTVGMDVAEDASSEPAGYGDEEVVPDEDAPGLADEDPFPDQNVDDTYAEPADAPGMDGQENGSAPTHGASGDDANELH
jgi:segregation and condensation protein B